MKKQKRNIEELKKMFPDNDEFEKNGHHYFRFVVTEIELPKELGKPYLSIMYDDENKAYVVMNVLKGLSEEEKEKKRKIRKEKADKRRKEKTELTEKIKEVKTEIKTLSKEMKFVACEEKKVELEALQDEYKLKFARKRH